MVLIAVGQLSAGMADKEIAAVRGRMELLLGEVGACVGSLPALVDSYCRDEAAFHERVTALERRESNCNEAARGLRSALADSLAAESFFHPTSGLVSLVTAVDAVPTGPSGSPGAFGRRTTAGGPPSTPNRLPTPSRFGSSSTRRTPSPMA